MSALGGARDKKKLSVSCSALWILLAQKMSNTPDKIVAEVPLEVSSRLSSPAILR